MYQMVNHLVLIPNWWERISKLGNRGWKMVKAINQGKRVSICLTSIIILISNSRSNHIKYRELIWHSSIEKMGCTWLRLSRVLLICRRVMIRGSYNRDKRDNNNKWAHNWVSNQMIVIISKRLDSNQRYNSLRNLVSKRGKWEVHPY